MADLDMLLGLVEGANQYYDLALKGDPAASAQKDQLMRAMELAREAVNIRQKLQDLRRSQAYHPYELRSKVAAARQAEATAGTTEHELMMSEQDYREMREAADLYEKMYEHRPAFMETVEKSYPGYVKLLEQRVGLPEKQVRTGLREEEAKELAEKEKIARATYRLEEGIPVEEEKMKGHKDFLEMTQLLSKAYGESMKTMDESEKIKAERAFEQMVEDSAKARGYPAGYGRTVLGLAKAGVIRSAKDIQNDLSRKRDFLRELTLIKTGGPLSRSDIARFSEGFALYMGLTAGKEVSAEDKKKAEALLRADIERLEKELKGTPYMPIAETPLGAKTGTGAAWTAEEIENIKKASIRANKVDATRNALQQGGVSPEGLKYYDDVQLPLGSELPAEPAEPEAVVPTTPQTPEFYETAPPEEPSKPAEPAAVEATPKAEAPATEEEVLFYDRDGVAVTTAIMDDMARKAIDRNLVDETREKFKAAPEVQAFFDEAIDRVSSAKPTGKPAKTKPALKEAPLEELGSPMGQLREAERLEAREAREAPYGRYIDTHTPISRERIEGLAQYGIASGDVASNRNVVRDIGGNAAALRLYDELTKEASGGTNKQVEAAKDAIRKIQEGGK